MKYSFIRNKKQNYTYTFIIYLSLLELVMCSLLIFKKNFYIDLWIYIKVLKKVNYMLYLFMNY